MMLISILGSPLLVLVDFARRNLSLFSYHFEFTDPWNVLLSYSVPICAKTKDCVRSRSFQQVRRLSLLVYPANYDTTD